jgi:hypothetical protein
LALYGYWQIRRPREGLRWNQQLLTHTELDLRSRLQTLGFAAQLMGHVGDFRTAENYASEAIALADSNGMDPPWGALMAQLMVLIQHQKDPSSYRELYERALQAARDDRYRRLVTEGMRGGVCSDDDLPEMLEHYERLSAEIERHGDPVLRCAVGIELAQLLRRAGHHERARAVAHSACDRRAGPTAFGGATLTEAGFEVLNGGDTTRARSLISEAVSIARDEGLTSYVLWGAFMAAALAAQRHDVATAAVLVAAADRHADRLGTAEPISRACRQIAQAAIDAFATDVTAVRHDGELMTIEDLISRTLDSVA